MVTHPKGNQTEYHYASYGDPTEKYLKTIIQKIDNNKKVYTSYQYDAAHHITLIQQGSSLDTGPKRTYLYEQGKLVSETNPETGLTTYKYDAAGQLTETKLHNRSKHRRYNDAGMLVGVEYNDSTPNIAYSYDANQQITDIHKGNTHWHYDYDENHHQVGAILTSDQKTWNFIYQYDDLDHLSSLTYPSGMVIDYHPDSLGRARHIGTLIPNVSYYPNGHVLSLFYKNGVKIRYILDEMEQIKKYILHLGDTLLNEQTISYDNNHNIIAIDDKVDANQSVTMAYNQADWLTTADGAWGKGDFAYDVHGNLITRYIGDQLTQYYYNDQLALSHIEPENADEINLLYDNYGNTLSIDGIHQQQFDTDNHLVASHDSIYEYDGNGFRTIIDHNHEHTEEVYNQSADRLVKSTNDAIHEYIYLNHHVIAENVQKNGSNQIHYLHNNVLGSPIAATNASGEILWQQTYLPFGQAFNKSVDTDITFTGKHRDKQSNLDYFGARYYYPDAGRFISIDPTAIEPKSPLSFNRYIYGNNNPYTYTDPDGNSPLIIAGAAAVAGAAIGAGIGAANNGWSGAFYGGITGAASPIIATGLYMAAEAGGTAIGLNYLQTQLASFSAGFMGDVATAYQGSKISGGNLSFSQALWATSADGLGVSIVGRGVSKFLVKEAGFFGAFTWQTKGQALGKAIQTLGSSLAKKFKLENLHMHPQTVNMQQLFPFTFSALNNMRQTGFNNTQQNW